MKKPLVLGSVILLCLSLAAFNTEINIDPFAWQNKKPAEELPVTINPGEPVLPFTPVNILLPFGHRYLNSTVQLSTAELVAENITFAFAGPQLPISDQVFTNSFPPANIIPENRLYPSQQWQFLGTQYFRGYQIALFNVYPYRYNPVTHKLYVSSQISISIDSEFSEEEACYQANFSTPGTKTLQIINSLICNPDKIPSYQLANNYRNVPVPNRIIDLSTPKQMTIITNNARIGWFSEYSAWRSAKGVSNSIYSMEDIVSAYPGVDNAEKLRNFIINAYQTWANSSQPL
ncbi:MAG: C25 family cysteine peptidase, partial [Candidatus Cloacimonas acidaminovorans]|nr:C25 family cysteine peptidase [Candidatus Cloacimonas acidaminovorans]